MMMLEKKKKKKKEKKNFDCRIEPLSKKNALFFVESTRQSTRQRKKRRFSTRSEGGAASRLLKWCFLPTTPLIKEFRV